MRPFTTYMLVIYLACLVFLTGASVPAHAIENGKPDSAYRNVGALGFDVDGPGGNPPFGICSGFVISDRAFVTAAHCITPFEGFAQSWAVTLEPGSPENPIIHPGTFTGANIFDFPMLVETISTTTVHMHPGFDEAAATYENDVAVLEFPSGTFDVPPVNLARRGLLNRLKRFGILKKLPVGVVGYGAEGFATNEAGDILGLSIPGHRNRGFSALAGMSRTRLFLEPTPVLDSGLLSGDSGSPQFVLDRAVALSSVPGFGEQRLDTPAVRWFLAQFTRQ